MKESKLYNQIVYTLYNIFKDDNLKARIVVDNDFKKNIINQINILLTLEKEYDCNFNNEKLTTAFAQCLADITGEAETIEKLDEFTFESLDVEYVKFLTDTSNTLKIDKYYLTQENEISASIIENAAEFVDKKAIDRAKEQMIKPKESIDPSVAGAAVIGGIGINDANAPKEPFKNMGNFNNNNFDPNQFDMNNFMNNMSNFPQHPRFDPRFYPYTSKPKYIPYLRYLVGILYLLSMFAVVITWFIAYKMPLGIDTTVNMYKDSNGAMWIVGGKNPGDVYPSDSGNFLAKDWFKNVTLLSPQANTWSVVSTFLIIIPIAMIAYELIGAKRSSRDKYIIRTPLVLVTTLVLAISTWSYITYLLPSFSKNFFDIFAVPYRGLNMNDPSYLGSILTPDKDFDKVMNELINGLQSSQAYKLVYGFSILSIVVGVVSIIASIVLVLAAPRFDREKFAHANEEYRKACIAAMKGEKYQMDPSLFDEEFDDTSHKDDTQH